MPSGHNQGTLFNRMFENFSELNLQDLNLLINKSDLHYILMPYNNLLWVTPCWAHLAEPTTFIHTPPPIKQETSGVQWGLRCKILLQSP